MKGAGGDRSFDAALDAGSLSFPSPPGTLQLQTTVRDAAGNILDEDRRPFVVPDFSGQSLAIGAPLLLRARTAAEARALGGASRPTPFAGREFIRTDHAVRAVRDLRDGGAGGRGLGAADEQGRRNAARPAGDADGRRPTTAYQTRAAAALRLPAATT